MSRHARPGSKRHRSGRFLGSLLGAAIGGIPGTILFAASGRFIFVAVAMLTSGIGVWIGIGLERKRRQRLSGAGGPPAA